MALTKIKGEDLILYVHDGTLYRPVVCLNSNSMNIERAVIESQTKCAPGVVERQAGMLSYTIEADAIAVDTTAITGDDTKASHDYFFDIINAGENVNWKMDSGSGDLKYYGNGILTTLDFEAPAGDEFANFTISIQGSGAIVKTDPLAPSV
jgi:Phage major tail protein 2.